MSKTDLTESEYRSLFHQNPTVTSKALASALDIRKFEIDLYWRRAAYFWTLIAAALAGFALVHASESPGKSDLLILLSNVGFVLSLAWYLVNRASKFWQQNWEHHVDLLEDDVQGPLYKTLIASSEIELDQSRSVSRMNLAVSAYVAVVWFFLIIYALTYEPRPFGSTLVYWLVPAATILFSGWLWFGTKSDFNRKRHFFRFRGVRDDY